MINTSFTSGVSALAISGLSKSTQSIAASTYRLSSGNRFYRAGDDVAALSVSTRLQSDITGLRQGQLNNSQADSLLQVAYGGLSQISSILDDLKGLAVQANSGSLTNVERAALDLEFQQLVEEIDSIAGNTNFNNINLLNGDISSESDIATTQTGATQATGSLNFTALSSGNTIRLNGQLLTADTEFAVGATLGDTVTNLANYLNSTTTTALNSATYEAVGNSLQITSRAGGTLGENYQISQVGTTATFTVTGQTTNIANVSALQGGLDDGIYQGSTVAKGTIGDSVITTQSQTQSQVTLSVFGTINNNEELRIDNGNGGTLNFRARTAGTTATTLDFEIGTTTEETLQNFVRAAENYSTASDYVLNQLEFEVSGSNVTIRGRDVGSVLDQVGVAANITETFTNGVISNGGTLSNGTNTGINTSGITNADFVGIISGFTATYNSGNNITAEITVGASTYSATIANTAPATATTTRFTSSNGGYFDVQLAAGTGSSVSSQSDADGYVSRLDAAFSTVDIYQSRPVSSFTGAGQLAGGRAEFRSNDFSDTRIDSISVDAPAAGGGSNATIEFEVNGERFRSNQLGSYIGRNETVTLTSLDDTNRQIRITNGNTAIDLRTDNNAQTFEDSLRDAFEVGTGQGGISFQLGGNSSDAIDISIGSATTQSLFGGASPNVLDQLSAAGAENIIDDAINEVTSLLAQVGADQSALYYSYNANDNTINQLDLARGILADTDIASESTLFAESLVKQQAAIAVLAQTQQLGGNLLSLLEPR